MLQNFHSGTWIMQTWQAKLKHNSFVSSKHHVFAMRQGCIIFKNLLLTEINSPLWQRVKGSLFFSVYSLRTTNVMRRLYILSWRLFHKFLEISYMALNIFCFERNYLSIIYIIIATKSSNVAFIIIITNYNRPI